MSCISPLIARTARTPAVQQMLRGGKSFSARAISSKDTSAMRCWSLDRTHPSQSGGRCAIISRSFLHFPFSNHMYQKGKQSNPALCKCFERLPCATSAYIYHPPNTRRPPTHTRGSFSADVMRMQIRWGQSIAQ